MIVLNIQGPLDWQVQYFATLVQLDCYLTHPRHTHTIDWTIQYKTTVFKSQNSIELLHNRNIENEIPRTNFKILIQFKRQ